MPGLKCRVLVGPATDDFAPNINVVDEAFDGPLDEYVAKNFANLKLKLAGLEQVGGHDVKLEGGQRAVGMVARHTQFVPVLEQTSTSSAGAARPSTS